jgi:hypothetical protein
MSSAICTEVSLPVDKVASSDVSNGLTPRVIVTSHDGSYEAQVSARAVDHSNLDAIDAANTTAMTSYHEHADLEVKVTGPGGAISYLVCSSLVSAASPMFREKICAMMRPNVSVDNQAQWIIELHEDPVGLDVLFSIIHYKFHDIPLRPTIEVCHPKDV